MPAPSTFIDYHKLNNAYLRLQPATIQVQESAKLNEIQQYLTWAGNNATLWDYTGGTTVISSSTAVARSTTFDYGHDFYHKHSLVRIVTTVGATPSATLAIQGSNDNSSWSNVNYADYLSPQTTASSNLTITTAGTVIKLIPAGQTFRYLSVNVTADTNVTITVDITMLG